MNKCGVKFDKEVLAAFFKKLERPTLRTPLLPDPRRRFPCPLVVLELLLALPPPVALPLRPLKPRRRRRKKRTLTWVVSSVVTMMTTERQYFESNILFPLYG